MFKSSNNLFSSIQCPSFILNQKCQLVNCIFSHKRVIDETVEKEGKKRKVESGTEPKNQPSVATITVRSSSSSTPTHTPKPTGIPTPTLAPKSTPIATSAATPDATPAATPTPRSSKDSPDLIVKHLASSPAFLPQRMSYLKTIHQTIVQTRGHPLPKKLAIHLEYKTASNSSNTTYPVNIRSVIKSIKSGKYRPENIRKNKEITEHQTKEKYKEELNKLIIPSNLLKGRRYVIELPATNEVEFDSSLRTTCDRCGVAFDIENKESTVCRYHQLRRLYDPAKKKRSDIFPCCSQPLGESNGCCTSERHVFKIEDERILASIIPYSKVPERGGTTTPLFAAAIDCEMAYTTFGMELIRLTVIDWDTAEVVLDRTIYPYGEVLDLNTRFSGVHSLEEGITMKNGEKHATVTFRKARELLFGLIDSSTILIGHGLENDLKVLRLCHPRVVDTAIRYPTLNPTRTHSLKELTFKYLGRTIQVGEHDSSEDALSAMDIIKENIKRDLNKALMKKM